ncbi:MAG: hypothetical protein A4E52_02085 [Pelotomaculum sp. PtaB.Bin013]|uniref:Uncharacterized protein n=1 Tax=Pelotomaculum isophthalicicum JI TaxID=947010 RepID=A0A9X4GYM5_9FIRM|nr:hypothetical protein [Pelotomaculum isophthalicicum]MDF9407942.1 hypothetical protein [Pelotomaculum isophthalicicum JI]OPX82166.1 MAG: hypothetical protein A4E52_02085 [Pelotomaculum sp. PtaB.Bin013]
MDKSYDKSNKNRKAHDIPQDMIEDIHKAKLNDPKAHEYEIKKNMSKHQTGKKGIKF